MLRASQRAIEPSRDWCSPDRGASPDPTLGLTTPLRIGVGSIVTDQDGTTDSFLAHGAWSKMTWLEGRRTTIELVDHPTDADYTISGDISGDLAYARSTNDATPGKTVAVALGYTLGGALMLTAAITAAVGQPQVWAAELGGVGLGVGLGGHIAIWRSDANLYRWNVTGHFTLRRNGVRIGEFYVDDNGHEARYQPRGSSFRPMVLGHLWNKAHDVIAPCIASDIAHVASPKGANR
jgi:hypothetical protein